MKCFHLKVKSCSKTLNFEEQTKNNKEPEDSKMSSPQDEGQSQESEPEENTVNI